MAVDAVHAALVVHVGRHHGRVVQVEDPVQRRVGRAGDVRPAGRAGRQLGEPAVVQADRGVAVVARHAGVRRRRARHGVPARVPRLVLDHRGIGALAQPVEGVLDVAGGAALAAVVAVEAHAPAHGPARGVQVALHALLAHEVGEVGLQLVLGQAALEGGHLDQAVDRAALAQRPAHGEDPVLGAAALEQAHLVIAVREVSGGRAVQARADELDLLLVAGAAGAVHDPHVHRVHEAPPGQVALERGHALVAPGAALALDVRPGLLRGLGVAPVAVDARELGLGVHVLDAVVAVQAAGRAGRALGTRTGRRWLLRARAVEQDAGQEAAGQEPGEPARAA